jgi:hypothetical protein
VVVREAEITADRVVLQATEQATRIEAKVDELRLLRKELLLKFRNTLDVFDRVIEAEVKDEAETAVVRTMPRRKREA